MDIRNIMMRVACAAMVLSAAVACEKDSSKDGDQLNESIRFTIEVSEVTSKTAQVEVTHNGSESDTWYAFLTDDVDKDEAELIDEAVEDYLSGVGEPLRKNNVYGTVLRRLESSTEYKYIVFGMSEDGKVYGTSASAEFTTKREGASAVTMEVNPAWTVSFVGRSVLYDREYDNVVSVRSTDDNTYAVTVIPSDRWNEDTLYDQAVDYLESMKSYISDCNKYLGTSYTLSDFLFTGDRTDAFDIDPGSYIAVALGITPDGEVTGFYAASEKFEALEAQPTEAYASWLGEWTVRGDNGAECTIILEKHIVNEAYWMYGWEGFEDLPVDVEYDEGNDQLIFYSQLVKEGYYIGGDINASVNMYFLASDAEDMYYPATNGEYGIAVAGILDDGQRTLVRYGTDIKDYPVFTTMTYAGELDGKYIFFTPTSDVPSFGETASFLR